jgi:hypothetical protein
VLASRPFESKKLQPNCTNPSGRRAGSNPDAMTDPQTAAANLVLRGSFLGRCFAPRTNEKTWALPANCFLLTSIGMHNLHALVRTRFSLAILHGA